MGESLPREVRRFLARRLELCPDPDAAVLYLERLAEKHPPAFRQLVCHHTGLQYLIAVFSHSRFLAEAVIARPQWLVELLEATDLERVLVAEDYEQRLAEFLAERGEEVPSAASLVLFRRRQLLRIVLRDVLGLATLTEAAEEVSSLADAVLDTVYQRLRQQLVGRHGVPRYLDVAGRPQECGIAVIALGKLGGRELNYSSDIDLMFVYAGNGSTDGERPVSNKEFFVKLASRYTELLSAVTAEGTCYRVDLRLRPDGTMGELCISLPGAVDYYRSRGRDWELQMLLKARAAAGDRTLGLELLTAVQPLIYSTTLDFRSVEAVSESRVRRHEKLAERRSSAGLDIKLSKGGIRDIEFLAQCLQRLHGGQKFWIRHTGTLIALARLRDKGFLSDSEYSRLVSAYSYLRHLEHRLQFDEDRQTHTLPSDPDQLEILARKMPSSELPEPSAESLLKRLDRHLEDVEEIYARVIHAQQPIYYSSEAPAADAAASEQMEDIAADPARASNLVRALDQRAPALASIVAGSSISRGWKHFENLLEQVVRRKDMLDLLDGDRRLTSNLIDIFEHSPYYAEQITRKPDLIHSLRGLHRESAAQKRYQEETAHLTEASDLRRYFQQEMLRIQARSVCLCADIFVTLVETSLLADATIAAAYRMAIEDARSSVATPRYRPDDQMMVVALGRLGMREFDLGSDADLTFVIPDEDVSHLPFWTRVVERMIQILTSYTGDGVIFAVDTRLRPNGGAGNLVQTVGAYLDYFGGAAQAWEGLTYMKARAITGHYDTAKQFLNRLQDVNWRRYGQSAASARQLRQMRIRIEKETGEDNPLKSGRGGYYDIDFILMFLRLRSAGLFVDALNTPDRIDLIEKIGHLERSDAEFLRDAATFFRALDHAMRVYSGHSEGRLPKAEGARKAISELVARWTVDYLHDQPIDEELRQIQERTRRFFDRVFGA